ncbi:MAG: hypothetical protein ACR2IT_01125 [Pirellulales bacterium]
MRGFAAAVAKLRFAEAGCGGPRPLCIAVVVTATVAVASGAAIAPLAITNRS